jgi:hypothetical protein
MIIKKFESFNEPEWREVNQDEWNEFYIKNKRSPIDSKDLRKLGSFVGFREGDTHLMMRLNRDTKAWIQCFEDEWWSVYIEQDLNFTMRTKNTHYICDGTDSMLDLIQKLKTNKGKI